MKLLRFRYIFPAFIFMLFGIAGILYAAILFDSDDSNVWYGPNNPGHTDPNMSFETNRDDFDSYNCPPVPEPPCTVDCGVPLPPDPVVIPDIIPPSSVGDQSDSF